MVRPIFFKKYNVFKLKSRIFGIGVSLSNCCSTGAEAAVCNDLDYIRGGGSFLNGMPVASLKTIRRRLADLGASNPTRL